jgi:hypothetical protein
MLPDIVRAAAEPMSAIDNLTVLSNDGASELVKNTTRTVTEASATVKGLTGLDVPGLISNAMGGATNGGLAKPRTGTGGGGGGGGTQRPTKPPTPPVPVPPAAASSKPVETLDQADAAMARAREAIDRATRQATAPTTTAAPGASRAPITSEMSVADAANVLADQLRQIPGIDRHVSIPLAELDQRGPRPLRAAWRLARDRVAGQYGSMTVGELLARFGERPSPPPPTGAGLSV